MRISDWSSDVCSSDLGRPGAVIRNMRELGTRHLIKQLGRNLLQRAHAGRCIVQLAGIFFIGLDELLERLVGQIGTHNQNLRRRQNVDRKSVVEGKSVSVRVDLGGRRIIKKKTNNRYTRNYIIEIHR